MSLLAIDNVSKTYGRTRALKGASLSVARGEVHALMGENGAGKSTLIKILAGVVAPDTMEMTVDGRPVALRGAQDAFDLGFRFIHQELNVVAHLSVAENMAMGKPCPRRFGVAVDWPALNAQAHAALDRLGVGHIDPRTKIGRLSAGDQMLVSIAGALSATGEGARLFVMDEPTASLTGDECDKLFAVIETLKSEGASVLYVSHRMNEVMAICDTVTVYRDGRHVATKPVSETGKDQIIRFMTGRDVADAFPPRTTPVGERVVCRVDDVSTAVLCGIDFALREGEILGIGGLANAGQSELLQMLLGLGTRRSGRVEIASAPGLADPSDAWTHGVAYVPRERRREGLMLARPITDNVVLPHLTALSRAGTIAHRRRERALTAQMSGVVRLKSDGLAQPVYQLSGGNQQKVVFARAVGAAPRLLLLDEPTRGVDVGAKFDIYTLIRELSGQGCAVVLTSSELTELIGLCDRILILLDGRQSEIVATDGLTSADLLGRFYDEAHGGHAAA